MAKVAIREAADRGEAHEYSFTVVFEQLAPLARARRNGKVLRRASNPSYSGYQVTVPLLPGLITYGRTMQEAREMARDAIKCHLEGLRKDGEPIPDERNAHKEKLRVALSA